MYNKLLISINKESVMIRIKMICKIFMFTQYQSF